MYPLSTDPQIGSFVQVMVALIAIVPLTLAAYWSRSAKKDSAEAKVNSAEAVVHSQSAKDSAAVAAFEVSTNGGMSDPTPNLNDHVKYQTSMLEALQGLPDRMTKLESDFGQHILYSNYMAQGMAEMYLYVMGREAPRPQLESDN